MKRLNCVMSWNTWDILTALFPVLCVFQRNKMASMVENASWKPLEIWFPRLLISKYPYMPRPSRTCAFGAKPACHLKTFWQPCSIHHIIMYFLIYSRLVTSVEQCWYLCSGPCLNSVNYWKWFSNFLSIWWADWQWFFSQANHGTQSNPGANLGAQSQVVQSWVKITHG